MRVFITGGNRGLGLQLVKVFHEHIVYPLVRTEAAVTQLKQMFSCRCFPILADLSIDESAEQIKN